MFNSKTGNCRTNSIDCLKAICAFLIVCIHVPFPGEIGAYFTALTRIAVPIFFMITGYFYSDTAARHKEKQQIEKIFYLIVEANVLFFIWNIALNILRRENIVAYIRSIFTGKNIIEFLALNESPVAGHLWYLGAILYVLVIVLLVDKLNCRKLLYYLTPVLLIADLAFGKYSLLIFHREFPYILVRNFLCVGIPYFCIGTHIREKRCSETWNKKVLQILIVVFAITSLAERFALVNAELNATRDHYLSTTFLAICLFVYALKSNRRNERVAVIGRKYSTWLYIIHPIFITAFSMVVGKLGIKSIYRCVAPIVVYCAALIFLIILQKVKTVLRRK
jgi:surface polysaccharide O-acyltransferase-like enzyme